VILSVCSTQHQLADQFTKGLYREKFKIQEGLVKTLMHGNL